VASPPLLEPPPDPELLPLLEAAQVPALHVNPSLHAVALQHASPEAPQAVTPASPPETLPFEPEQAPERTPASNTPAKKRFIWILLRASPASPPSAPRLEMER
jgi:hypothetical protein